MAKAKNTSWTEWECFGSFEEAREVSKARGVAFIRFGRHYAVPKTKRVTHVFVHFPGSTRTYSSCKLARGGITMVKKPPA